MDGKILAKRCSRQTKVTENKKKAEGCGDPYGLKGHGILKEVYV